MRSPKMSPLRWSLAALVVSLLGIAPQHRARAGRANRSPSSSIGATRSPRSRSPTCAASTAASGAAGRTGGGDAGDAGHPAPPSATRSCSRSTGSPRWNTGARTSERSSRRGQPTRRRHSPRPTAAALRVQRAGRHRVRPRARRGSERQDAPHRWPPARRAGPPTRGERAMIARVRTLVRRRQHHPAPRRLCGARERRHRRVQPAADAQRGPRVTPAVRRSRERAGSPRRPAVRRTGSAAAHALRADHDWTQPAGQVRRRSRAPPTRA